MQLSLSRRNFLLASASTAALALARPGWAAEDKKTLHKALIGTPTKQVLEAWKAVGFEGIEATNWQASPQEAEAARKLAESLGMRIHSVLFGWAEMNAGPAGMEKNLSQIRTALRAAQAFGADALLLVPCRIGGMKIPRPRDFDIRFDETTGHLRQVVAGDNTPYQEYMEAHNQAVDASREGVKRLIPDAEKSGVIIALENVWNNLWVKPDLFAHFVASFNSRWVQAYFDIGNHVKYAPPEQWIRTLGKLIVKCHVKDFRLSAVGEGDFCEIREGSVNWPAVRKALDEIGYSGWLTIEDANLPLAELSKRLDRIIAGE